MAASQDLRNSLVDGLRQRGMLRDSEVERAFRAVPRERFVPDVDLEAVYRDDAIATKHEAGNAVSSSSQPGIMALMLEQLDVQLGHWVLEIGAGTGYNAALLRELVGDSGHVTTVDIDPEVAGWARERLNVAGYESVEVICADGADGWSANAPYDRIELTVGAGDIAPAWVAQLREGGLLVLPLWITLGHVSIAFEKRGNRLVSRSVLPCGFMPLRGRMAHQPAAITLSDGPTVTMSADAPSEEIAALLAEPVSTQPWVGTLGDGSMFYFGLWGVPLLPFRAQSGMFPFGQFGICLYDADAPSLGIIASPSNTLRDLTLFGFGNDAATSRLLDAFDRWVTLGRPGVNALNIEAIPRTADANQIPDTITIDTDQWRLLVRHAGGVMTGNE